jgi:Zn-dependent protease
MEANSGGGEIDGGARKPRSGEARSCRRGLPLQAILFLITCLTTFLAGCVGWQPLVAGVDEAVLDAALQFWPRGLLYTVAVMAVLVAHEAGHFIAAGRHGIPATLPFFIPVPILLTGTLGAVIGMEGSRANRRQLFDIAVAGPLAGLCVALPALAAGIALAVPDRSSPFAMPPVAEWLVAALRPDLAAGSRLAPNALFMAGWVGLLVTGLNMIPVSQLDGGHVSRALFGGRSDWLARGVLLSAIAAIVIMGFYNWIALVVVVTLMGADHPPIREDGSRLGPFRTVLGLAALAIPLMTFMPEPLLLD